jgi:hypothetical protein
MTVCVTRHPCSPRADAPLLRRAASAMVCNTLEALGVRCVTPESLRLAKVEDHASSTPRLPLRMRMPAWRALLPPSSVGAAFCERTRMLIVVLVPLQALGCAPRCEHPSGTTRNSTGCIPSHSAQRCCALSSSGEQKGSFAKGVFLWRVCRGFTSARASRQ